jgi:hypothetical protein
MSDEEHRRLFRDGQGWVRFYDAHPESNGIVGFSRVGFNAEITQALIYVGIREEAMAGHGSYWFFTRESGRWEAAGEAPADRA